jgi:hypothetical protein
MWFGNVALEDGVINHLREVRLRLRGTEERLGEEDNERLAEVSEDLAAENVEVVGGCTE